MAVIGCTFVVALRADLNRKTNKRDLIELSNIKYGLFNVDEWRKIVSTALSRQIEGFEVDQINRAELKTNVSTFLTKVIVDLEARYYQQNASNIGGLLKNGITGLTGTFERLKKDVPIFAEQIIEFLDNPENKKAIRNFLISKIDDYAAVHLEKVDYALYDSILKNQGVADKTAAVSSLTENLGRSEQVLSRCRLTLAAVAILTAILMVTYSSFSRLDLLLLNGICLTFLLLGLLLPMIEIDARISEIRIELFGERTVFENQVLYFKSKSVLEVVWLMVTQGEFGLRCVGALIFTFSVLFPLSKLTSMVLMQIKDEMKSVKAVQWLVKESGKWSMADVMVVAIFMAYIGFSGILSEQLRQLEKLGTNLEVLTTNHSTLQTGFFAFTGFVLLSMLLTRRVSFSGDGNGTLLSRS